MKASVIWGGLLSLGLFVGCGGPELEVQVPDVETASSTEELFPDCQGYWGMGCPRPYMEVQCDNSSTGLPGFCICQPDTLVFDCL
jgi:hypothetical protein